MTISDLVEIIVVCTLLANTCINFIFFMKGSVAILWIKYANYQLHQLQVWDVLWLNALFFKVPDSLLPQEVIQNLSNASAALEGKAASLQELIHSHLNLLWGLWGFLWCPFQRITRNSFFNGCWVAQQHVLIVVMIMIVIVILFILGACSWTVNKLHHIISCEAPPCLMIWMICKANWFCHFLKCLPIAYYY